MRRGIWGVALAISFAAFSAAHAQPADGAAAARQQASQL